MTALDLAALEALHKAASPGPWSEAVYYDDGAYPVGPYTRSEKRARADAALIAAARNAMPELIRLARIGQEAETTMRVLESLGLIDKAATLKALSEFEAIEKGEPTFLAEWAATMKRGGDHG